MLRDRDHYRSLHTSELLLLAREEGINPEMAVALADKLAEEIHDGGSPGQFHFNMRSVTK